MAASYGTSTVSVASGAVLGGTGSTTSNVDVASGADYTPGADPNGNTTAQFETGSFTMAAGSNFNFDLNGAAPGSGYDQTVVTGSVILGEANFNFIATVSTPQPSPPSPSSTTTAPIR